MARIGISYETVASAAQQLEGQGKQPTVMGIRAITNAGSSTTIANHLREWKRNQGEVRALCSKEQLPDALVHSMKGLWHQVMEQAEVQIAKIKDEADEEILDYKAKLNRQTEQTTHWQQQTLQLQDEKKVLLADKASNEQRIRQLEDAAIKAQAVQDKLQQQLDDKSHRIQELQHSHKQVQANLEHYREVAREQRISDQQRHEQVQNQLDHSIRQLEQQLKEKSQQHQVLTNQCESLKQDKQELQTQLEKQTLQHKNLQTQLNQTKQSLIQSMKSLDEKQQAFNELQQDIKQRTTHFSKLQTQTALLAQQIKALEKESQNLKEQNQQLAHEKWELGQEKAQLLGQLQLYEKTILN